MLRSFMTGKIHRATVTEAALHYEGSLTVDAALMDAAGLLEGERVDVVSVTTGARLSTYLIAGGEGVICANGAAAHLLHPGDMVIIMAYGLVDLDREDPPAGRVVLVDERNRMISLAAQGS